MRTGSVPAARIGAAAALLASVSMFAPMQAAADDTSNYGGENCSPEQYFDATVQRCLPELVTNDPQGEPQPQDIGANYDGTKCDNGLFYNASDGSCTLEAVTNDPKTAEVLESGNPIDSNLPVGSP